MTGFLSTPTHLSLTSLQSVQLKVFPSSFLTFCFNFFQLYCSRPLAFYLLSRFLSPCELTIQSLFLQWFGFCSEFSAVILFPLCLFFVPNPYFAAPQPWFCTSEEEKIVFYICVPLNNSQLWPFSSVSLLQLSSLVTVFLPSFLIIFLAMTFLAFLDKYFRSSPADDPGSSMGQQYQAHWKYFVEVQLLQTKLVFQADCGRDKKIFSFLHHWWILPLPSLGGTLSHLTFLFLFFSCFLYSWICWLKYFPNKFMLFSITCFFPTC